MPPGPPRLSRLYGSVSSSTVEVGLRAGLTTRSAFLEPVLLSRTLERFAGGASKAVITFSIS
eukprot:2448074-Pleurochrysis_carterae.AAC.1